MKKLFLSFMLSLGLGNMLFLCAVNDVPKCGVNDAVLFPVANQKVCPPGTKIDTACINSAKKKYVNAINKAKQTFCDSTAGDAAGKAKLDSDLTTCLDHKNICLANTHNTVKCNLEFAACVNKAHEDFAKSPRNKPFFDAYTASKNAADADYKNDIAACNCIDNNLDSFRKSGLEDNLVENKSNTFNLHIFPVPATTFVNIAISDKIECDLPAQIIITGFEGRKVFEGKYLCNLPLKISTSDWAPGIYTVAIVGKMNLTYGKIVISE